MANVTGWYAEVSTAVTVPRMSATALLKPPAVESISPFIMAPPRMAATATMKVPALGFSTTLTVPRMAATAVMATPTLANAVNAAVTAPRMNAAAALAVPAVSVSYAVTAPRMGATAAMATPSVTTSNGFSDTFNRSNSASLGTDWNTDAAYGSSLAISSNAAVSTGSSIFANIYTQPMSTGNNLITLVMKGTPTAGDLIGIVARSDAATDSSTLTKRVEFDLSQGAQWTIARYNADVTGAATSGNESWAAGDTIACSCVGATLTIKRNGSTVLTTGGATDLAAGYIELFVFVSGAGVGFDSFAAVDI